MLGAHTVELHDDHHENFMANFQLSYTYLDRFFGTYVDPSTRGPDGLVQNTLRQPLTLDRKSVDAESVATTAGPLSPTTAASPTLSPTTGVESDLTTAESFEALESPGKHEKPAEEP